MRAFIIVLLRAICKKEIFIIVLFQMILFYPIGIILAQAPDTLWTKIFKGYLSGSASLGSNSIQQTSDGGYIITGTTDVSESQEVLLIKTNENGDTLWTKTFGSGVGHSVQQTSDGGYALFNSTLFIKTDSTGDTLWTKLLPDFCNSARQTSDGGYIITAYTVCWGCSHSIVTRTNSSGEILWIRDFGPGSNIHSAQQTSDGGFIIAGENPDLEKLDSIGNTLWTQSIGGGYHVPKYVQQTSDGGYIIAGWSYSGLNFNISLVKTDANGHNIWIKTFGGNLDDFATSVQQTFDGGYVVTGVSNYDYSTFFGNLVVIKTDSNGNSLWTKTFEGGVGNSILQTSDGGYIVAGQNISPDNPGIWLIRFAPDVTAVDEHQNPTAKDYRLHQNYPNPFNPSTAISYHLSVSTQVSLKVYDVLGNEVASLVNGEQNSGSHSINFNAAQLSSGIYFYRLDTENFSETKPMLLIK